MSKNVVWWPAVRNPDHVDKYGGYEYFQYSRATWEYWCERNDCLFVPFEEPVESDLIDFRVNWQKAIFVFDELERRGIDYDQIALMDSSSMIKWNAPNFFELTERKFCGFRDIDNLKWIYESVQGYKEFFNNFELDLVKYISSGIIIFNGEHKEFFIKFKQLYYDNKEAFKELQDNIVKKGTEQTPFNYFLQMENIDLNLKIPVPFKLTHIYRKDMYSYNWQLEEDKTPFFIKYAYNWVFNGIPKNERTRVMRDTWSLVAHNYNIDVLDYDTILDEVKHRDSAKYTPSRQFKYDLLDTFYNDDYKDKTVLELGTSQGMTTRVLSHIFNKVYTVELDDWNIEQAKKHCDGRNNVEFIQADLYNGVWELPKADVVYIDAGHQYFQVKSDIENSLKHMNDPIFIFDDYGLPPGEVKMAIDEEVKGGNLKIDKFIGESPENLVHAAGTEFFDMEGCICNL